MSAIPWLSLNQWLLARRATSDREAAAGFAKFGHSNPLLALLSNA